MSLYSRIKINTKKINLCNKLYQAADDTFKFSTTVLNYERKKKNHHVQSKLLCDYGLNVFTRLLLEIA